MLDCQKSYGKYILFDNANVKKASFCQELKNLVLNFDNQPENLPAAMSNLEKAFKKLSNLDKNTILEKSPLLDCIMYLLCRYMADGSSVSYYFLNVILSSITNSSSVV